ncbi:MAG: dihydroneopterin aldolase [Verrucomicrobia bacterium]|nr:dihydroneopterin aldolase [Verrucomicrobiota bacterium]
MDRVVISNLAVACRVGVTADERRKPQQLLLTIELELDISAAAAADDLKATIDYYQVSRRLLRFGARRRWRLIETLAVDIAHSLLREFRPASVTVGVKKFAVPEADHVAVWVTRAARRAGIQVR